MKSLEEINLDIAAEAIRAQHYQPTKIDIRTFSERLVDAAERDYMDDESNRLYQENGILDQEVFSEWAASNGIHRFDYVHYDESERKL